jgi:hypothetical protein
LSSGAGNKKTLVTCSTASVSCNIENKAPGIPQIGIIFQIFRGISAFLSACTLQKHPARQQIFINPNNTTPMKRSYHLWTLALIITLASAVFQRMTGPSYPKNYVTLLDGKAIEVVLERSHGSESDHPVTVNANHANITGRVEWKRYNTNEAVTSVPMIMNEGVLMAPIPHQPPAGKLQYTVFLTDGKQTFSASTVIRFRGEVPTAVLIFHIAAMFIGMLLSTRAGLEFFAKEPSFKKITYATFGVITLGGMILGPLVLNFAFNEWWTGFPFGSDITDNKTLIAFLAWLVASVAVQRSANPKRWVLAAAIVTLLVFLIPHSLWGTELNYNTMKTN